METDRYGGKSVMGGIPYEDRTDLYVIYGGYIDCITVS